MATMGARLLTVLMLSSFALMVQGQACDDSNDCNCCCNGDSFTATTIFVNGGSGSAAVDVCRSGQDELGCCNGAANSITIQCSADLEALIQSGTVDREAIIAEILEFLQQLFSSANARRNRREVGPEVLLELVLITIEGDKIIIRFDESVDPDTLEAAQAQLNTAIDEGVTLNSAPQITVSQGAVLVNTLLEDDQGNPIGEQKIFTDCEARETESSELESSKKSDDSVEKGYYDNDDDDDAVRRRRGKNDDKNEGETILCVLSTTSDGGKGGKKVKTNGKGKEGKGKSSKEKKGKGRKYSLSSVKQAKTGIAVVLLSAGVMLMAAGVKGYRIYSKNILQEQEPDNEVTPLLT
eukprot:m.11531 g.11531  ORF g.11531 m.11531 type:complete len:352 (-) comp4471_c0_seq1:219-1274(-)